MGDSRYVSGVEHILRNDGVACSSHASGTKIISRFNYFFSPICWRGSRATCSVVTGSSRPKTVLCPTARFRSRNGFCGGCRSAPISGGIVRMLRWPSVAVHKNTEQTFVLVAASRMGLSRAPLRT